MLSDELEKPARNHRPAGRGTEPAAVPRRRARSGGFRHRLRAQTIPDPFGDARFLSNRRDTSDFPRSEAAVRADGRRREAQYGRGGRRTRLHPTAPSRRLSLDESEIEIESEEDLRCTAKGQISLSLGGETIFSINLAEARRVKPKRGAISTPEDLRRFQSEIRARVQRLTAFERPAGSPDARASGEIARDGYRIEKLLIGNDPAVPALLFIPDGSRPKRRTILYVHENGKAAEAKVGGEIEELVRGDAMALAIDLRGRGETREEADRVWDIFGHFESAMTALLVRKTLVGLRAEDVIRAIDALAARRDVEMESLSAFGKGDAAVVLLHAAALDDRIKSVTLEEMLVSYESVVDWKI